MYRFASQTRARPAYYCDIDPNRELLTGKRELIAGDIKLPLQQS